MRTGVSAFGPIAKSVSYNYLQTTTYDLNNFGNFTGYVTDTQPGISIAGNILTLIPQYRQQNASIIPITAYDPDGLSVQLVLKMYPNINTGDYIMGCDSTGTLYKIDCVAHTETIINNYDGSPVTFPNLIAMAMNVNDNILFYTLSTSSTVVRAYNFATNTSTSFLTSPITVRYLSYDNFNNVLYITSATDGQGFVAVTVTNSTSFGYYNTIPQPFTSVGCTKVSMTILDNLGTISYCIIPLVGNTQLIQCYKGNTSTAIASSFPPVGISNLYLTTSLTGKTWFFSSANKTFYTTRLNNNSNLEYVSLKDFVALSRPTYQS